MTDYTPDLSFEIIPDKMQGGGAWVQWRQKGMGGSDAPIIMNKSEFKTPRELYYDKLTPQTYGTANYIQPKQTFAQERGHRLEPIARAKYEELTGYKAPSDCFEREGTPFRASLDGHIKKENGGLEIKCLGIFDHAVAQAGIVPSKYFWQLVHQFYVCDLNWIDYFSYFEPTNETPTKENISWATVRVYPDKDAMQKYVNKAKMFWHHVETKTPPPLDARDWQRLDNETLDRLGEKYKTLKFECDLAGQRFDVVKEEIRQFCNERNFKRIIGGGIKVSEIKKGDKKYLKIGLEK